MKDKSLFQQPKTKNVTGSQAVKKIQFHCIIAQPTKNVMKDLDSRMI